jgi:hypothetical protein
LFLAFVLLLSNKKKTIRNWLFVSTIFFSMISLGLKVYVFYYGSYFSFFIVENFSNPAGEMAVQLTITSLRMMFYEGQFMTLLPVVILFLYQRLVLRRDIAADPLFYPSAPRLRRQGAILFALGLSLMVLTTINGTLKQKTIIQLLVGMSANKLSVHSVDKVLEKIPCETSVRYHLSKVDLDSLQEIQSKILTYSQK